MSTEDRTPREDDVDDVVTVDEAAKKRRLPRAPAWLLPVLPIAVLGAAGVLAGGGASYIALAGQASGQQRVADARDHAVAAGTARLMDVEFRRRAEAMAAAARTRRHPTDAVALGSRIPIADQRLVASAMSPASWAAVADALAGLDRARAIVGRQRGARLDASDLKATRRLRTTFRKASAALAAFAGDRAVAR